MRRFAEEIPRQRRQQRMDGGGSVEETGGWDEQHFHPDAVIVQIGVGERQSHLDGTRDRAKEVDDGQSSWNNWNFLKPEINEVNGSTWEVTVRIVGTRLHAVLELTADEELEQDECDDGHATEKCKWDAVTDDDVGQFDGDDAVRLLEVVRTFEVDHIRSHGERNGKGQWHDPDDQRPQWRVLLAGQPMTCGGSTGRQMSLEAEHRHGCDPDKARPLKAIGKCVIDT